MDFEKKYWSNGEFSKSNGEKYYGYVGVYAGLPYIFDTEEQLTKNETFTSKVNLSDSFFDRTLSHKLELPYKKEDVIFAANDFLYAGTVKTIIERLQENNVYLYQNAIIPNSILPVNNFISLFATEDVNEYFFYYQTNDSSDIKQAPKNAILRGNEIFNDDELLGNVIYIINEFYKGDILDENDKYSAISDKTAEEVYQEVYNKKNSKFSRIPKIEKINNINSGILKRYSFTDKGLDVKTHIDPYFNPQRKYKEYIAAKTILGTWEDTLSADTVLIKNADREAVYFKADGLTAREAYNIVNDIDIDRDVEDLDTVREELENIESRYNLKIDKAERYYDNLSGEYILGQPKNRSAQIDIASDDLLILWNDFKKSYDNEEEANINFNLQISKISFLIKFDNIEDIPELIINGNISDDKTYIKSKNGFYHLTYYFNKTEPLKFNKEKWNFELSFDNINFYSVFNALDYSEDFNDLKNIKYTLSLSYGTEVPGTEDYTMSDYNYIPLIEKSRNCTWRWYNGETYEVSDENGTRTEPIIIEETLPTLTYRYLTESPAWINAKSPSLVYYEEKSNENKLIPFKPSEDMTAEDCYIFMTNNLLSYRNFPEVKHNVAYNFILKNGSKVSEINFSNDLKYIENKYYKCKNYNLETFTINENLIKKCYKSAGESYRELNEVDGKNNKNNFDFIPEFQVLTTTESETIPGHDFSQLTNAEMHIIKRNEEDDSLDVLLFLMFENKILIIKIKHYIDETKNFDDFRLNLRSDADKLEYIEIDCVDPKNKNSLTFKHLNDIKLHKNMLYVADGELNMVIRYDIEYLISPEEEHSFDINSIKLLDVLQGDGEINDKIYFNNPFCIAASDDRVYIVDRGNKCVKVYSPSLNYIKILKNGYYATHDIQAVAVNPYPVTLENGIKLNKDSLWIFSVNSNNLYLSIIDNDSVVSYGQIEDIRLLSDKYSWVEEFKNVEFSQSNSNLYYIATTKRVYKLQVSRPYYPLGSLNYFKQRSLLDFMVWGRMHYRWTKLPSIYNDFKDGNVISNEVTWSYRPPMSSAEILDNRCFTLAALDGINDQFNGDLIFHLGTLYDDNKVTKYIKAHNSEFKGNMTFNDIPVTDLVTMIKSFNMLFYIEPDSYISSLNSNFINVYDINVEDITFEDYINALTFNKMIYAVVYNLLSIKNQLIGNFKAATNLDGIIVYDNMILNDYFANLEMGNEANYFAHDNEVISIIINRVFESIYNIQQKMLDNMQTTFMAAPSYVNNTSRII